MTQRNVLNRDDPFGYQCDFHPYQNLGRCWHALRKKGTKTVALWVLFDCKVPTESTESKKQHVKST